MKTLFKNFLCLFILVFNSCSTQRTIIPKITEQPRYSIKLNKPVLFSILDSKTAKENSNEVLSSLKQDLFHIYGKSIKWKDYFEKVPNGNVSFNIRLKANEANFGSRIVSTANIKNVYSTLVATVSNNWNSVIANASSQQTLFASSFYAEG